ncbi:DUF1700 domain-containing protein [Trinickia violacea]|uniref:DUF1700 domain-containing protein n=1 Tax=Trinickia violacea TaxID=2571746 RepID=A0A4P8IPW6_9BURK|nr:DUF1700 domain-containing protein [Trinickia violacea]QCP47949.1 DUF1700 domain-containing protein [Trinickia violacea]
MKQDAFIQQLRQELGRLPKEAVDEIVADYREYIGDALAAGRQEEEVIAALGDPVKLARELKAQANYRQWEKRRSFGNLMRVVGAVAGLGFLQLVLLVPFLLYLFVLTLGYVISSALAIAGLVTVLAITSHHFFGKPALDALPFSLTESNDASTNAALSGDAASADEKAADALSDMKDLKIVGNRFVFDLQDGGKVNLVTRAGPLAIRKDNDKLEITAPSDAARALLTNGQDSTLSIARDDVTVLDLRDEDGDRVSFARTGPNGKSAWHIRGEDDENVSFEQDPNGHTSRLVIKSGEDSVTIDGTKIAIANGKDHVQISNSGGLLANSANHGMAFGYALAMLAFGILGLVLCVWLTRFTWRALARYVKHQIDIVTASLDREQAT